MRVHGAAARETDGGRCFAEGCRWLYGFGEGVDYTEAASYLKRGAQLGHALSAAHLASILMEGKGVRGNPRAAQLEATMWAMRSCDAMGLNDQAAGGDAGRAARARAAAPGGHRLRDEPGAGREPLPRGGHGGRRRGHELPRGRRRGGPRPGRRARRDGGGLVPQGRRGGRRAGAVELRARAHAGQGRAPGREGRRRLVRARGRPGRPRRAELARALLPGRALRRAHRRRRGGAVVHARGGLGRRRRAGRARRHVQGGAGRREGRREGPRLLPDRRGRGLAGRAGRAPQPRPDGLGAGRPLPQNLTAHGT